VLVNSRRILTIAALALVAAGCSSTASSAQQQDRQAMADIAGRLQNAQPIPAFPWSQYRQTIIDAETAQANGTQTTSFWFARGAAGQGTPIGSCPSLGFPVPASAQLSNPESPIWRSDNSAAGGVTVGQMEPNGVYSGPTDGTYVVCAGQGGKPYLAYVEADVITVGGPAEWKDGRVQLTGDPTIKPGTKQ
jgi:hypothetical protein